MGCQCGPGCNCGCGGKGDGAPMAATPMAQAPQGDRLNNPSLDQGGGQSVMLIDLGGIGSGDLGPEGLSQLLQLMVGLANRADSAGMQDSANEMDGMVGKMAKLAQYEGFINYWLANGRAFERAWKIKRQKQKPDDMRADEHRSAHEAWFEVLEEYQKGLLTDHKEFLGKYAAACECNDAKLASRILMGKIADKMRAGSAPGVAVYEAIDELTGPYHKVATIMEAKTSCDKLAEIATGAGDESLAKEAQMVSGFWDALTSPFKGWLGTHWNKVKNWFQDVSASGGQSFKLMRSIRRKLPLVVQALERAEYAMSPTSTVNPSALESALTPVMVDLKAYHDLVAPVVGLPPIPNASDPRYQSRVRGGVDRKGYEMFIADLKALVDSVNDKNSLVYERSKGQVQPQAAPQTPQSPPEDTRLLKVIENMLDNLNNSIGTQFVNSARFSAALQMHIPKMINDAIEKIREPDDFMEFAAAIRDRILDLIQRPLNRSGVLNNPNISPQNKMRFTAMFEHYKASLLKDIESVLRKRHNRKFEYRQQPQQPQGQAK